MFKVQKIIGSTILLIFTLSCASSVTLTQARWKKLEWNINIETAVFYVEYCEQYRFFKKSECKKDRWKRKELDVTDKKMREKLKLMGFKLKVVMPTLP